MAKPKISISVNFGTVSVGKESTSIGVKFEESVAEPDRVKELLCKRRVSCKLETRLSDEDDAQTKLKQVAPELEASGDTGRVSMGLDDYSARISFSLGDVSPESLVPFRNRPGWLRIYQSGHIPEPAKE